MAAEPRTFLVDPKTWKRKDPAWKPPGTPQKRRETASAMVQQHLAVEIRRRLFVKSEPLYALADRLRVNEDQFRRKMSGAVPMSLPDFVEWALVTEQSDLLEKFGIPPLPEAELALIWP